MGCCESKDYNKATYKRLQPQDIEYMKYCVLPDAAPQPSNLRLELDGEDYVWILENGDRVQAGARVFKWDDTQKEKSLRQRKIACVDAANTFTFRARPSLVLAAAAYSGERIKHLLDGYSASVVLNIGTGNDGKSAKAYLNVLPVEAEVELYNKEKNPKTNLLPGLFTPTNVSCCAKVCCGGRLVSLVCLKEVAVSRNTAHQPIYYPVAHAPATGPSIIYCSAALYFSYTGEIRDGFLQLTENGWQPQIPRGYYYCMHPHTDPHTGSMLTFGFYHSVFANKTGITFYEYNGTAAPIETKYELDGNIALHMFGFTENYYVIFANPLQLVNSKQVGVLCGEAVLRALEDTYVSNLVIHIIPRNGKRAVHQPFSINTYHQGFVYHSINQFETADGDIVVDAFVSQLNASRESAQFELNTEYDVYDNMGDPVRFILRPPTPQDQDPCKSQILATVVDSTIDFHTINNSLVGRPHHHLWIVGHERVRGASGLVVDVVSKLYKIDVPQEDLNFNPLWTVEHARLCDSWTASAESRVYLRTPLFIPSFDSVGPNYAEDKGYIAVWSYEFKNQDSSPVALLLFDAHNLNSLLHIPVPSGCYVPYSVHSWVHPDRVTMGDPFFQEDAPASSSSKKDASSSSKKEKKGSSKKSKDDKKPDSGKVEEKADEKAEGSKKGSKKSESKKTK